MTETIRTMKKVTSRVWALGLLTAVLNGLVNCGTLISVDGLLNLEMGWKGIVTASLLTALHSAYNYFRKTPWPWEDDIEPFE